MWFQRLRHNLQRIIILHCFQQLTFTYSTLATIRKTAAQTEQGKSTFDIEEPQTTRVDWNPIIFQESNQVTCTSLTRFAVSTKVAGV